LLYGFIKIKFKEIVMNALFTTRNMFVAMVLLAANSANADTITAWTFDNLPVANNNTPAPSTGVGNASSLGMTNSYTYTTTPVTTGSVTTDDIYADPTVANDITNTWRIRGASTGNGWNLAAPQYTQGAQFTANTAGYNNIDLNFGWISTAQGIRDMQVQYTTNGSIWNNVGGLLISTPSSMVSEDINFGALGITSVNNDANFGVRLVSAYDPTLGTYASSTLLKSGSVAAYNNNSGNWRFDNVVITGVAAPVPEADTYAMMLVGLGLMGFIQRRRKSA